MLFLEEANSVARTNRTDWAFAWERKGFRVKEAPYRLQVAVQGDQPGAYLEFLKMPEAGKGSMRGCDRPIIHRNDRPHSLRPLGWRRSVRADHAGPPGLGSLEIPAGPGDIYHRALFRHAAQPMAADSGRLQHERSYASFVATEFIRALVESLSVALLVVIAFAPGEPLYRADQPGQLRLGSAFTFAGLRTRQFFCSGFIGLCLAAVHIGYVVGFYVVGRRLGVWAPQDLQYSDTLSTSLPRSTSDHWHLCGDKRRVFVPHVFHPLPHARDALENSGRRAAGLCLGLLALQLPAGAALYPWHRSRTIGIVAGWVMLRWGILATLIWHYTVDAFLTSLSLMRSRDLYTRISGGIVVSLPLFLFSLQASFISSAEVSRTKPTCSIALSPWSSLPSSPRNHCRGAASRFIRAAESARADPTGCGGYPRIPSLGYQGAEHWRFRSLSPG